MSAREVQRLSSLVRASAFSPFLNDTESLVLQWSSMSLVMSLLHLPKTPRLSVVESSSPPCKSFHARRYLYLTPRFSGYTGLQLLAQIIIGDLTNLRWRGLVSSLMSLPFIINAFVGTNIATTILKKSGWRWGCTLSLTISFQHHTDVFEDGMFAILIPAALAPLILTLLWGEWKARKLGYVKPSRSEKTLVQKVTDFFSALNVFGLLLLGASIALILLPLTLYESANGRFKNPSMIAMVTVGCLLLPVFVVWEWKFAKHPVIPTRFLKNRTFVIAALVGAFDFVCIPFFFVFEVFVLMENVQVSFYISWAYLFSFVLIVKPW